VVEKSVILFRNSSNGVQNIFITTYPLYSGLISSWYDSTKVSTSVLEACFYSIKNRFSFSCLWVTIFVHSRELNLKFSVWEKSVIL
jgi:hypothetical protein